jgi:H2-forming N5,N10-methylenetetrahydromethanopterin dehydrogenase-like enzyme
MKIALFHNPGAGERALDGNQLIRHFAEAGHDVLYVPTQQKGWNRRSATRLTERLLLVVTALSAG